MKKGEAEFQWNAKRERAAALVADDSLSDEQIAAELKVGRATLARWKDRPEFIARVREIVESVRAALEAKGIAARQNRIDALNERHELMREVIRQRASAYQGEGVGGSTGLIVKDVKGIGRGYDFQVVEVYGVDTGLLRELREHEKQMAQELGEWQERSTQVNVDLTNCSDDELERIANGEDPARVLATSRRGRA